MTKKITIYSIITSSDHDSRICNDILSYYTDVIETDETRKNDDFVFTRLGRWLLEHHIPFVNEFGCSTIPKSYRLHTKRSYIQNRINDLVNLNLLEENGTIKSEKNSTIDTPIYHFTSLGSILAWLLKAKNKKGKDRVDAIDKVLEILLDVLNSVDSFSIDLFIAFLKECIDRHISTLFGDDNKILTGLILSSLDFISSLNFNVPRTSISHPIRFFRVFFSIVSSIYKDSQEMLVRTINDLDMETQKIIMLQLKLEIESVYSGHYNLTKAWEKMRYSTMPDYQKVTVQGRCDICKAIYPFQTDIIDFLKLPYLYVYFQGKTHHELKKIQKLDCTNCAKQNSVDIIPGWHTFDDDYYGIFSEEQIGFGV